MSMPQGVLGNKYVVGIVGMLFIIVIVYNTQFFMSRQKTSRTEKAQPAQKRSEPARQPDKALPVPAAQPLTKEDKGKWKRDPFSLRAGPDRKAAEIVYDIKLMGIIKRDGNSRALIDGKVYGVNDRIGTAIIKEIKQHSIVLLADGKKQEISFDDYKVIKEKKK
ncbi:MAG: hypothetical protein HZA15_05465 [Nitrospirae bacterium]|nr:hypothetical protein [Nitrospirota bacterium]